MRYDIYTEDVGEILTVTLALRHRQLSGDWYLRYVTLGDVTNKQGNEEATEQPEQRFPCHSVVQSMVTLRPGNGTQPQL